MAILPPNVVLEMLNADKDRLNWFIEDALKIAAPIAQTCAEKSVLVKVPVWEERMEGHEADVVLQLGDFKAFKRAKMEFDAKNVRFRPFQLRVENDYVGAIGEMIDHNEREGAPQGIVGFTNTYRALCIRLHARLNCVTVQIS